MMSLCSEGRSVHLDDFQPLCSFKSLLFSCLEKLLSTSAPVPGSVAITRKRQNTFGKRFLLQTFNAFSAFVGTKMVLCCLLSQVSVSACTTHK